MGDADFVKVPVAGLIDKEYAAQLRSTISMSRASKSSEVRAGKPTGYEAEETTHFTVVDAEGNVVSNTYTLNGGFGSGVIAKGTGVLMNNEMDDFAAKPGVPNAYGLIQGERNAVGPRKRPLCLTQAVGSTAPSSLLECGSREPRTGSWTTTLRPTCPTPRRLCRSA